MRSCARRPLCHNDGLFEPSIETRATLTNNADFDTGSQREADLVFNVLPAISFLRDGPRLRVAGSAALNFIGYADGTQTSRILPQANILANLEAIERLFFVEAALVANQDVLNPFLSRSDSSSTFNKYTYVQGRVSPYVQGNFGPDWRYLVRSDNSYTHTTQSGNAQLADSYYGRHFAEVSRTITPLGGSLRVQSDVTRFDDQAGADQHIELVLAKINYAFTPQFSAGLRGGYERTNYTVNDTSGSIYGAEFGWTPNPRTRLAGFWESRFFGPSYQFDLSNRQRRLATNLSASRAVTTYPQLVLQLPGTGNVSGLVERDFGSALSGPGGARPTGSRSDRLAGAAVVSAERGQHLFTERQCRDVGIRQRCVDRRAQHAGADALLH